MVQSIVLFCALLIGAIYYREVHPRSRTETNYQRWLKARAQARKSRRKARRGEGAKPVR